jgi:DNA-binding transcriptional ArsR family regulator
MDAKALDALRRVGTGDRGVEEAVSYAVGHRIRIEILAALHEGPENASGLAKIVRQPVSTVSYHIEELLADGSIEVARTKKIRANMLQHYYIVVKLPEFSSKEVEAMEPSERQALFALIVQAATAEALASLWAGKMILDPLIVLIWNRFNLDEQGRRDATNEQDESWERLKTIAADSMNRMAESGERGASYVFTSFGFERCRTSAPPPLASGKN